MTEEELQELFDEDGNARQKFSMDMADRSYLEHMLRLILEEQNENVRRMLAGDQRLRAHMGAAPPSIERLNLRWEHYLADSARVVALRGEDFISAVRELETPADEDVDAAHRERQEWAERYMAGSSRIRKWLWERTLRRAQQRAES
jgi:hypothetical protein